LFVLNSERSEKFNGFYNDVVFHFSVDNLSGDGIAPIFTRYKTPQSAQCGPSIELEMFVDFSSHEPKTKMAKKSASVYPK